MKTDQQLRTEVVEQLQWEPSVHEAEIATAVKNGVVTLSGYVASFAEKHAAMRAIERLKGGNGRRGRPRGEASLGAPPHG
jgi:osmotically-inducible protein OsmY